jgi:hypothetical protein
MQDRDDPNCEPLRTPRVLKVCRLSDILTPLRRNVSWGNMDAGFAVTQDKPSTAQRNRLASNSFEVECFPVSWPIVERPEDYNSRC